MDETAAHRRDPLGAAVCQQRSARRFDSEPTSKIQQNRTSPGQALQHFANTGDERAVVVLTTQCTNLSAVVAGLPIGLSRRHAKVRAADTTMTGDQETAVSISATRH